MARIGLPTIISFVLNLFLTFWLVNQYMSDAYFQAYVNATIGQYYPFIVLTLGVGGGSGLGYVFLKRRHGEGDLIGKIQKSKGFRPASPSSGVSASPSRQILPAGAPPSPASKHTVYAVPPLPKSPPSSSRLGTGTTWAATKPSTDSTTVPRPEPTQRPSMTLQPQRIEPSRPQPSFGSGTETPPSSLNAIGSAPSKIGTGWTQQPSQPAERRSDFGPAFQKPGLDTSAKQNVPSSGFQTPAQTGPVPSKWASPSDTSSANQYSDQGVRSIPPMPSKWAPPSGSPAGQDRPAPPPQGFPRPSSAPVPIRGPVPPQQGPPRPFAPPGPRPGEPRPIAAPRPFRPEPLRPPGALGPQPRPPQPGPRPAASLAGPMPQPWSPTGQSSEKKEQSTVGFTSGLPAGDEASSAKSGSDQKPASDSGGGGEMDWDTALDTILKTLRKDRVGDTK